MFVWDQEIPLHPMQGIWALTSSEGDVSWDFSSSAGTWDIFSNYCGDVRLKLHLVQRSQDSCLVRIDTSGR